MQVNSHLFFHSYYNNSNRCKSKNMQIPFNQFELYIDETILKRGLSYFKKGFVSVCEEVAIGVYQAYVIGEDEYTVELNVKGDTLLEHNCSCPYDLGPICKHVVAVLFYLQQDALELRPAEKKLGKSKSKVEVKKTKKKSVVEQLEDFLELIPRDELKHFVKEVAVNNTDFRNQLMSNFAVYNTNETKELYAKQVKAIIRKAMGRDDFIYGRKAEELCLQVSTLITLALKQIDCVNYKSSFFISAAVMDELTPVLQFADDSYGDISGNIFGAFDVLKQLTKLPLNDALRVQLLHYFLSSFENGLFEGWDWHVGVLALAADILITEQETQLVISCLDRLMNSTYLVNEANRIKLEIYKRRKSDVEIEDFIQQNLSNSYIRIEAIQRAVQLSYFEKATSIAWDGVKLDEKDRPGLALDWYDWLLKIAQAQNDTSKIIEYARLLFMRNFTRKQDYYQVLSNAVSPENWNPFLEKMIVDISSKRSWLDYILLSSIFIKEGWWDRLLNLVKKNPTLDRIEQFEKVLSEDYSKELVLLYCDAIKKYMEQNTGRKYYQSACRYLRRIIKLGGQSEVDRIVANFRVQYYQRKALMEELNRL
ncbi:MAG: SWIM zinc finger domain-containing protein [Bacteroidia bacterium]